MAWYPCCCVEPPCILCDEAPLHSTSQDSYTVTFFPGASESDIIVAGPISNRSRVYSWSGNPGTLYACCWAYNGILSDITGIADDENGTCDESSSLNVSLCLYWSPFDAAVGVYGHYYLEGWHWMLGVELPCPGGGPANRGAIRSHIEAEAGVDDSTANCSHEAPNELTFPVPGRVDNYDWCGHMGGMLPSKIGCLDADRYGRDPDFPSSTLATVVNG